MDCGKPPRMQDRVSRSRQQSMLVYCLFPDDLTESKHPYLRIQQRRRERKAHGNGHGECPAAGIITAFNETDAARVLV
jgi:hypothetical protein